MMILLHALELVLLVIILVYVVRLSKKENFANCFGAQYDGLNYLENKMGPICPASYNPYYRTGGCAQYDPQEISVEYANPNNKFIRFV